MGVDRLLEGKRVVVTGASRGLGRAFAVACAKAGAAVVLNGRDADTLGETVRLVDAVGGAAKTVVGSVANYDTCEAIVACCVDEFGGIDCLVNNAGINRDRTLMRMSPEDFDEVIAVNLRGSWACGKFAALAMKETGGSIVNVVSNSAFQGVPGQTNYAASKAGVAGMTRTWTRELDRYGIRVNAIWPLALTDMTREWVSHVAAAAEAAGKPAPTPEELGLGDPDKVAELVVYLASDETRDVTGQVLTYNGRKLALWSHPREVEVTIRDDWSLATLVEDFPRTFGANLQELYAAL